MSQEQFLLDPPGIVYGGLIIMVNLEIASNYFLKCIVWSVLWFRSLLNTCSRCSVTPSRRLDMLAGWSFREYTRNGLVQCVRYCFLLTNSCRMHGIIFNCNSSPADFRWTTISNFCDKIFFVWASHPSASVLKWIMHIVYRDGEWWGPEKMVSFRLAWNNIRLTHPQHLRVFFVSSLLSREMRWSIACWIVFGCGSNDL